MTNPTRSALLPAVLAAVAALAGCASAPPEPAADPALLPTQWYAPLPHNGRLAELTGWWQQFDDPVLAQLVDAAQAVSPTLATARSRVAQSQATRTGAGAALLPTLDASASASRGRTDFVTPLATTTSAGLQTAWEIDVFGAGRAGRDAAQYRLEGAEASWHDARVSVAAETANAYLGLRACEAQLVQTETDAASRAETARLTGLSAKAGFEPPATAALSRASAAQGASLLTAQRAQCDIAVKGLVALTAIDEPALRDKLAAGTARIPQPAELAIDSVPAEVLNQRPDVFNAARELGAASAEVSQARAKRLPRVTLAGSISRTRVDIGDATQSGTVWSVGPLAITLPVFDAGVRRANVDAARARYDEASSLYRAKLRTAVQEVEQALVQLDSSAARNENARIADEGFEQSFRATEARFKGGLASLFELEDARRSAAQAHATLIDLQRERVAAWITLYRALGGGWRTGTPVADAAPVNSSGPTKATP
jgi:NodT family efflux transporter outer membrane factor (OMF) lipoprotein